MASQRAPSAAPAVVRAQRQQQERDNSAFASDAPDAKAAPTVPTSFNLSWKRQRTANVAGVRTANVAGVPRLSPAELLQQWPSAYGAASRSSASRMDDAEWMRTMGQTARPTHQTYTDRLLSYDAIADIVNGTHGCTRTWSDEGEIVECHHALWARSSANAIKALTDQRTNFLSMKTKARGRAVYDALVFASEVVPAEDHHLPTWKTPYARVLYRVEVRPGHWREVCRSVFLAHYPVSNSTLKRIVARKRAGESLYQTVMAEVKGKTMKAMTLNAISWMLSYAQQVSEKLPDQNILMTPFRHVKDIWEVHALLSCCH